MYAGIVCSEIVKTIIYIYIYIYIYTDVAHHYRVAFLKEFYVLYQVVLIYFCLLS